MKGEEEDVWIVYIKKIMMYQGIVILIHLCIVEKLLINQTKTH